MKKRQNPGRAPYTTDDVPDRIYSGEQKVTRQPTGRIVHVPGGNGASQVREQTVGVNPMSPFCDPSRRDVVQFPGHVQPSFEARFVHRQACVFINPDTSVSDPWQVITSFTVPTGYTFFWFKFQVRCYDTDTCTIRFQPRINNQDIPNLNTQDAGYLLPTYPDDQQNIRAEVVGPNVASIVAYSKAFAVRRVAGGIFGWLERIKHDEKKFR